MKLVMVEIRPSQSSGIIIRQKEERKMIIRTSVTQNVKLSPTLHTLLNNVSTHKELHR